jgi:hypothetical protein
MGIKNIYERFVWFDHQVRARKFPNATKTFPVSLRKRSFYFFFILWNRFPEFPSPNKGEGQGEGCLNFVLHFFLNSDILNSEKYMEVQRANRKIRHSRN